MQIHDHRSLKKTPKRCLLPLLLSVALVNFWLAVRLADTRVYADPDKSDDRAVNRDEPVLGQDRQRPSNSIAAPCPHWCHGFPFRGIIKRTTHAEVPTDDSGKKNSKPYFLTAVLSVRIYDWKDKAKLSTRELIQWLRYISYAGGDHVYLYDAYVYQNESQKAGLKDFIASGFLTYTDWHHRATPFSLGWTQAGAYLDCLERWGNLSSWQLGVDMDEYPFLPADREPGFLARYLREFDTSSPTAASISELSMQNFLYLGKPLDVAKHPILIDRIWRRTKEPANHLVKPVYRPAAVRWPDIHHNSLKYGTRKILPETDLRMNHYWGARLQNWGEDTQEVLEMTMEDRSMEPIVTNLYKCDSCRPP
ncbi:uncharacterized protein LOC110973325 [Acanthaster planci]|uniref:Glycosyltransferase family 92 protein n=1 Tax=Acanthaster planci TaxID=133434 RepID=A0A8B7XIG0_ACAPL|nr:uncharacterized protein LOC110973325 [Acanthaster planci]